jgi:predicted dinucleotide-utilizing enzyme
MFDPQLFINQLQSQMELTLDPNDEATFTNYPFCELPTKLMAQRAKAQQGQTVCEETVEDLKRTMDTLMQCSAVKAVNEYDRELVVNSIVKNCLKKSVKTPSLVDFLEEMSCEFG